MQLNWVLDKRRILAQIPFRDGPFVIVRQDESGCAGVCKSTRWWWNIELWVEVAQPSVDFTLLTVRLKAQP
jgi:hypothetical protein